MENNTALMGPVITGSFEKQAPGTVSEQDSEYTKALRLLDAHFVHPINIPFEKHQFRQAKQEETEMADQFMLRLFKLSEYCKFGGTYLWSIYQQMQVSQPLQEIASSKWNVHTLIGAGDCKINRSSCKSSKIDREWFQGWQCIRIGG